MTFFEGVAIGCGVIVGVVVAPIAIMLMAYALVVAFWAMISAIDWMIKVFR